MRSKEGRYWVNQPSTLQQGHSFHGRNVIATVSKRDPERATVWFTENASGTIYEGWTAIDLDWTSLSPGWKDKES